MEDFLCLVRVLDVAFILSVFNDSSVDKTSKYSCAIVTNIISLRFC